MKAYELGPADGFDALQLVERASPQLGPGEVRVRVRAASLNYRDLLQARSAKKKPRPIVPLSDGAGDVVEVGAGVERLEVGDRVAAAFFPEWHSGELTQQHHDRALGGGRDGMLAEEVVLPERAFQLLPAYLSYEEASTLPCAGVTAYSALFEVARLLPGDTLLVQGTGGVSLFALQLARAAGAQVIVTSQSAEKRERALALGAAHVIDYKAEPAWGKRAFELSGGKGVDLAVDVGGPGTFNEAVASLRFGGSISILGVLTGTRGEINTYAIFHKRLKVAGVYVGSTETFDALNRALTVSELRPVVDRVFEFGAAREAYEYLASARHFGKVVVRVG